MSSTTLPGRWPSESRSCENEVSGRTCMIFGCATKVPLPWVRSSRPSTTSSAIAWRTVVREVAKRSANSRSVGMAVPADRSAIMSRSAPFTR